MPFTNTYEKNLLDALFGKSALAAPSLYMGLSTTTPTRAGGNVTEPSAGYARVACPAATWAAAVAGDPATLANSATVEFPAATASWGTITYFTLHTAATGGAVVGYGLLTSPLTVSSGDIVVVPVAGASIRLGDPADF